MIFQPYNKKAFLLPDSIDSAAMYHAKIFTDGRYIFRIHDCLTGIRLIGELRKEQDFTDAFNKTKELALALTAFAFHIERMRCEIYNKPLGSSLPECMHDQYCDQITKGHFCKSKTGCNFQDQSNN